MDEPCMVLEGSVIELRAAGDHVDMVAMRRFIPTARPQDHQLAYAIWRGFNARDRNADRTQTARPGISDRRRAVPPSSPSSSIEKLQPDFHRCVKLLRREELAVLR